MTQSFFANVALVGAPIIAWAIGCGSSSSNPSQPKPANCPIGSEGCPCTSGKACDKGLICFDPLCFKPTAAGDGGRANQSGGANGRDAGPNGGGPPGAGGASGAGGATAPDGAAGAAGSGGASVALKCPFPGDGLIQATEQSDLLGSSKDKLDAKFSSGGLVELDSKACTPDTSGVVPTLDWGTYPCRDGYVCGGCLVFVISPTDAKKLGNWTLIGVEAATSGATHGCPEYSGTYTICAPDCAGKQCGDDGCGMSCGACGKGNCCNKQDQCIADGCSQCLDACFDACGADPTCSSSCCTGSGCQCEGACPGPC